MHVRTVKYLMDKVYCKRAVQARLAAGKGGATAVAATTEAEERTTLVEKRTLVTTMEGAQYGG